MQLIESAGIFTMPAEQYHADPAPEPSLSASIAKSICIDSPLHAKLQHPRLTPLTVQEEATHFDIGTIAHALLLEGESVAVVVDYPDWRTKAAREARDAIREAGRCPVLSKHWTAIQEMMLAAREQLSAHKEAANMFTAGKPEQTLIWFERDEKIWCRSRLDWLFDNHRFIDDYKTTGASANPEVISRTLFANGWDIQAALYLRGLRAIDPSCDPVFRFACQETFPPYAISVISLGPDVMTIGEKKVMYAIEKFAECMRSGRWPAYPDRICYPSLPVWEETKWLMKEELA